MVKKRFYSESELVFKEKPTDPRFQDLTNLIFGRLKVLGFAGSDLSNHKAWFCKCKCGNVVKSQAGLMKAGRIVSCGCFHNERRIEVNLKHGFSKRKNKTYSIWKGMRARCNNANNPAFHRYGGRGIKVCERWNDFENFLEDMGEKPDGFTIDRIDNNGNYCPENCRWATRIEQANNTRNNVFIEYDNQKLSTRQWDRELGLCLGTTWQRIFTLGWTIEKAIAKNG